MDTELKEKFLRIVDSNSSHWEVHNIENSFAFERIDVIYWANYVYNQRALSYYAAAIYFLTIFGLEKYMKNRKPFDLRRPLILWNAALGIFSAIGFVRSFSTMIKYFDSENGFYNSICTRDYQEVPMVFWGLLFGISKFFELGDTLFIILRKRPLQLLQWYHHICTLVAVWVSLPYAEPMGRYCIIMNYGVHSLMYPYFALKMAGINVPKAISNTITTMQLAQMLIGFFINGLTIAFLGLGYSCYRVPVSIYSFFITYGTFIVLFGELFVKLVLSSRKPNRVKKIN